MSQTENQYFHLPKMISSREMDVWNTDERMHNDRSS